MSVPLEPWNNAGPPQRVSVVIPARNEAGTIRNTVAAVLAQDQDNVEIEVVVVDDGSTDKTAAAAQAAGGRVLPLPANVLGGNPGAARNRGAAATTGDPIIFLDADCVPTDGWLRALLTAHQKGESIVGGSLGLAAALPATARCDYYSSSYHTHPRCRPGHVANHPPANLSVRRSVFAGTSGFSERFPAADGHEELAWQAEARRQGHPIYFEPTAVVHHRNRAGFANLLQRGYRWGYSVIESKTETGASRLSLLYRYPRFLIAAAVPAAVLETIYVAGCWLRVGTLEPILMVPGLLAARLSYALGVTVGGIRWLRRKPGTAGVSPRWR